MCSPTLVTDDAGPGTLKARHNYCRTDSSLLRMRGLAVRYGIRTHLAHTSSETCLMEVGVVCRDVPEMLRPECPRCTPNLGAFKLTGNRRRRRATSSPVRIADERSWMRAAATGVQEIVARPVARRLRQRAR